MKALMILCWAAVVTGNVFAATVIWGPQDARDWDAVDAIWETSPGVISAAPGIGDTVYILSTNEVTVDSAVAVRDFYLDRAYSGYTTAASQVTVVSGGSLTIDRYSFIGHGIAGGTLHVAGGDVIFNGTGRSGTYSLVADDNYAGIIQVTAGSLSIRNGSTFYFQAGSQADVTVSGTGVIEFTDYAALDIADGARGVSISDTGRIRFAGRDATGEIQALAQAGKLRGKLPPAAPLYPPAGFAKGVGWYHDGTDTWAFAVAGDPATFVVSDPQAVEDVTLRKSDLTYREDGYWTDWNFGRSQVLDVGYTTAVWNQYHAVSLLRFDLRGVPCQTVLSATLRLYKPRNVTQITPSVPVAVYVVKGVNKEWKEGSKESIYQYRSASWKSKGDGAAWAGGESGCSVAGLDHDSEPLGSAVAVREAGQWLEFDIPAALVQQWLENPTENAGLVIKAPNEVTRGEHVLFYSSEHHSGKGPQLVISGMEGAAWHAFDRDKSYNPRYVLPPQGTRFNQYLVENNSRYKKWTLDPLLNLDSYQRIFPYFWDIIIDGQSIVPDGYMPIADRIPELDSMIAANDVIGLRKFHLFRQRCHHVWEYNKENQWYESGDVIEILSPYQAALIWCRSKEDSGGWDGILTNLMGDHLLLSEADIEYRVTREVNLVANRLELTADQLAIIGPVIAQEERTRCEYFNLCKLAIEEVQQLILEENNGPEIIDALSRAMVYHDIFLYHDSFFGGTRWPVIMDNSDMVKYTTWWIDSKYGEFSPDRIGNRWNEVLRYWPETWPQPTLGPDIPETCFDARAYGFVLPADLSGPVEGQPDCYVDLHDLAFMMKDWLSCYDYQNPECTWAY